MDSVNGFVDYLNSLSDKDANRSLSRTPASFEWGNELSELIFTKSLMAAESKTRTSTTYRIIQPVLTNNPVEDSYTQIVIEERTIDIDLDGIQNLSSDAILDYVSTFIADMIDRSIVAEYKQSPFGAIVSNQQVFGHVSESKSTIGGYINTDNINADVFKEAFKHFPVGYRQRAKWVMNENTAKSLVGLKVSQAEGDPIDLVSEVLDGIPHLLLNKPIVINKYMPDVGIIAYVGDMSRGYIMSKYPKNIEIIVQSNGRLHLTCKMGGAVLQPASFKGINLVPEGG